MHYESTATYNDSIFQMIPPLVHPLRFWTPRVSHGYDGMRGAATVEKRIKKLPLHVVTVKGGFVNCAGGERRLIIAGKIFKRRGL
jgi:hypothetical protein